MVSIYWLMGLIFVYCFFYAGGHIIIKNIIKEILNNF